MNFIFDLVLAVLPDKIAQIIGLFGVALLGFLGFFAAIVGGWFSFKLFKFGIGIIIDHDKKLRERCLGALISMATIPLMAIPVLLLVGWFWSIVQENIRFVRGIVEFMKKIF